MSDVLKVTINEGIAWLTLHRPEAMNALNSELIEGLTKAIKDAGKNDDVRTVVITGEGRGFCSGQDLKDVQDDVDIERVVTQKYNPLIKAITHIDKPVIAAVNGTAAGAGMSLALACDFRLVHEKAKFTQAFIHIGLVPDSGSTYFLPRLLGHAKALELALLGDKVSAEDAERLGLATKVFTAEEWDEQVHAFAAKTAGMPTKAMGLIKRYMQKSWDEDLDGVLQNEAYAQSIAADSYDHKEGIQAFIEKRQPAYKGQ